MKRINHMTALLKKYGVFLALLVLLIVSAVIFPHFLTYGNITNVLNQNSMIGIISIGMTFVILTGGIDLSVGSIAALSSVIAAVLSPSGNLLLMIAIPLVICTALGMLNGLIVSKLYIAPFIATLGMQMAARGAALAMTDGVSVRVDAGVSEQFRLLARSYVFNIPTPVWIFAILFAVGFFISRKTRAGRHIYAVGGNEDAALMMGLRSARIKLAVYTISGFLAGLAGILLASRVSAGQPVTCEGWEMNAIAATAIGGTLLTGGRGGLGGTVIGVLIVGIISNIINLQGSLNSWWQSIITGILLLLVVMLQSRMDAVSPHKKVA